VQWVESNSRCSWWLSTAHAGPLRTHYYTLHPHKARKSNAGGMRSLLHMHYSYCCNPGGGGSGLAQASSRVDPSRKMLQSPATPTAYVASAEAKKIRQNTAAAMSPLPVAC